MILRIAFVTESNYHELQQLCEPNVIGIDYADFLRIVDQTLEHAKILQIETVRVSIDPSSFASWLNGRTAKRLDLLRYADLIHRNPLNHDEEKFVTRVTSTKPEHEQRKASRKLHR